MRVTRERVSTVLTGFAIDLDEECQRGWQLPVVHDHSKFSDGSKRVSRRGDRAHELLFTDEYSWDTNEGAEGKETIILADNHDRGWDRNTYPRRSM